LNRTKTQSSQIAFNKKLKYRFRARKNPADCPHPIEKKKLYKNKNDIYRKSCSLELSGNKCESSSLMEKRENSFEKNSFKFHTVEWKNSKQPIQEN